MWLLDEWDEHYPRERWEAAVYRIGNLTLLEAAANRRVGNENYAEKRDAYEQRTYSLTRRIAEMAPEHWTPELLEARQSQLAKRAVHLWRSDFA